MNRPHHIASPTLETLEGRDVPPRSPSPPARSLSHGRGRRLLRHRGRPSPGQPVYINARASGFRADNYVVGAANGRLMPQQVSASSSSAPRRTNGIT